MIIPLKTIKNMSGEDVFLFMEETSRDKHFENLEESAKSRFQKSDSQIEILDLINISQLFNL